MSTAASAPAPFGRTLALHSLGWLALANLVGLWLAISVLWPRVGDLLVPLTFGRWAPLHLNWQLYGWCSLPLVGSLLAWCFDPEDARGGTHARIALGAWSAALVLGGIAWLSGTTSGKPFLDWYGWSLPLLPAAMYVLWGMLALHTYRQWPRLSRLERLLRSGLVGSLFIVPLVLMWAASRTVYPSVNPDSGGATGSSILGASLGIVAIYMFLPRLLGVRSGLNPRPFIVALVASWLVYATVKRGYVSHHRPAQVLALGTMLLWIPLLPLYWARHEWSQAARPWLRAAAVWWAVLALTGWLTFLPGMSERLKFTHALVAHAHLAMAGLVTSVNAAIVVTLAARPAPPAAFWLWQVGCAVYIVSMSALGWVEVDTTADLFRSEVWTQVVFSIRLAAGLAMSAASIRWFVSTLKS